MNAASALKRLAGGALIVALSAGTSWAQGGPAGPGNNGPMGPGRMGWQGRQGGMHNNFDGQMPGPMMRQRMEQRGGPASQPATAAPAQDQAKAFQKEKPAVGDRKGGKARKLQQLLQTHPQLLERLKMQGYQGGNDPKQLKAFLKQNPQLRKQLKAMLRGQLGKAGKGARGQMGYAAPLRGGIAGPETGIQERRHRRFMRQEAPAGPRMGRMRRMGQMGPMAGRMGMRRMGRMGQMGPMAERWGMRQGPYFGQGRGFRPGEQGFGGRNRGLAERGFGRQDTPLRDLIRERIFQRLQERAQNFGPYGGPQMQRRFAPSGQPQWQGRPEKQQRPDRAMPEMRRKGPRASI